MNHPHGKSLIILGTRGVPAAHGGFETFAEHLALYLVERGWHVTVYCQNDVDHKSQPEIRIDDWCGIRRVTIDVAIQGAAGTMAFDAKSIRHAMREPGLPLVLGYNTAIFTAMLRLGGRPVLMNMDGIEWKRAKWGLGAKLWLYLNEQIGARMSSRLIADHPEIADHLASSRQRKDIITIPYGADEIVGVPDNAVKNMGLTPGRYFISIGRIEPENSILEMVTAFAREPRSEQFICLGRLDPETNPYHWQVSHAAAGRVLFPGAIYDKELVRALRFHALAYCHGHTVGGTNPSLVEAMGASSPVIAHNNRFNQWVAGQAQLYFSDIDTCAAAFTRAGHDEQWRSQARSAAHARFIENFRWDDILSQYERLCADFQD